MYQVTLQKGHGALTKLQNLRVGGMLGTLVSFCNEDAESLKTNAWLKPMQIIRATVGPQSLDSAPSGSFYFPCENLLCKETRCK